MDFDRIFVYVGLGGFVLWSLIERGFSLSGQQQSTGSKRHRESYWLINLFWYGAILFSMLDALSLRLTVFGTSWWALRITGLVLTISGLAIRYLARRTLGQQYSVHVETSATHNLVTTGIYGIVRHPAYLGLMCLLLGIPLSMGSWAGITIAVAGGIPAIVYRIILEEKLLKEWFGKQYAEYEEKTWRLVPYLW